MLAFFWAKIEPAETSKSQVVLFYFIVCRKTAQFVACKKGLSQKKLHMCVAPLKYVSFFVCFVFKLFVCFNPFSECWQLTLFQICF